MTTLWEDLTEAEREEANELAYAAACDRLRAAQWRAHLDAPLDEVRQLAYAELAADIAAAQADIRHGQRTRATRLDRQAAAYAERTLARLALVEGFIWDAEF